MKKIITILTISAFISCSSFSKISNSSKVGEDENGRTQVTNEAAGFRSLTFGDFKFATNLKEFSKLNETKPKFNNILFYAKTTDVPYEYYVLYNPKKMSINNDFIYKDTIINKARFVLAISKTAPKSDAKFIMNKMLSSKIN